MRVSGWLAPPSTTGEPLVWSHAYVIVLPSGSKLAEPSSVTTPLARVLVRRLVPAAVTAVDATSAPRRAGPGCCNPSRPRRHRLHRARCPPRTSGRSVLAGNGGGPPT